MAKLGPEFAMVIKMLLCKNQKVHFIPYSIWNKFITITA